MMPRDASLSDKYTSARCGFSTVLSGSTFEGNVSQCTGTTRKQHDVFVLFSKFCFVSVAPGAWRVRSFAMRERH